MKSAVTTTETFKYILIFTFLFAAFLALAITYNKAYKQKNDVVSVLEKYDANMKQVIPIINKYLNITSYKAKGNCNDYTYGIKSLDTLEYDKSETKSLSGNNYYYCLDYSCLDDEACKIEDTSKDSKIPNGNSIYYEVKLFYKFNLPFLGDLMTFGIKGETKAIKLWDRDIQILD